jgi:hypothetical protein
MNDEKWYELVEAIREKLGIEEEKTEDLIIESRGEKIKRGKKEIIVFNGAAGKMKLEREVKPIVLEKKLHYHRRKDDAQAEYVFSPDEFSYNVNAYVWDETLAEWQKIPWREDQI